MKALKSKFLILITCCLLAFCISSCATANVACPKWTDVDQINLPVNDCSLRTNC